MSHRCPDESSVERKNGVPFPIRFCLAPFGATDYWRLDHRRRQRGCSADRRCSRVNGAGEMVLGIPRGQHLGKVYLPASGDVEDHHQLHHDIPHLTSSPPLTTHHSHTTDSAPHTHHVPTRASHTTRRGPRRIARSQGLAIILRLLFHVLDELIVGVFAECRRHVGQVGSARGGSLLVSLVHRRTSAPNTTKQACISLIPSTCSSLSHLLLAHSLTLGCSFLGSLHHPPLVCRQRPSKRTRPHHPRHRSV